MQRLPNIINPYIKGISTNKDSKNSTKTPQSTNDFVLSKTNEPVFQTVTPTDTKDTKQISTARAENVAKYLVAQGVNAKRISAQGLGRVQPLKDCRNGSCTPEEDEKNRRIDVKIKGVL